MNYKGSCHCGGISFEVEGEIKSVLQCDCSMCQRKGSLLWFVPREMLKMLTPDSAVKTYTFNKHMIMHRFCPVCGLHPYGESVDPQGNPIAAINIRCLEGIDIAAIPVHNYAGRSI